LPYLKHSDADFRADVARALAHQTEMSRTIIPELNGALASELDAATRTAMAAALEALMVRPHDQAETAEGVASRAPPLKPGEST
jgi:hypothetical protein